MIHLRLTKQYASRDDEEYARLVADRKADEEDFEGYWESRYGDIY